MKRASWNTEPDETGFTEKELAIAALRRMYNPDAGIEGSQMNSVFDISVKGLAADQQVTSYGCFSHNEPKKATSLNIMRGSTTQQELFISQPNPNIYMRVRHSTEFPVKAQSLDAKVIDEGTLMFEGLVSTANRIAAGNPTGMGAGTDPNRVFEALLESSINLPEMAMNGATIGEVQKEFIQQII